ncbi:MAG TPA: GNAT family N-acetyltransferase [Burkholderiaceae bacterium]
MSSVAAAASLAPAPGARAANPAPAFRAVDPQGAAALALLAQAALEARALYPELFTADSPSPVNAPPGEGDVYLVAFDGDTPVACGALRRIDVATAEVRRLFVLAPARRRGLARATLAALEDAAIGLGYDTLLLETGHRQQPAMALYDAAGFTRIPPFGPYAGDPTSVCFGKRLATAHG